MSTQHQHSRKNFITKLVGLGMTASVLPALATFLRRPETARPAETSSAHSKKPFSVRADTRAIARSDM